MRILFIALIMALNLFATAQVVQVSQETTFVVSGTTVVVNGNPSLEALVEGYAKEEAKITINSEEKSIYQKDGRYYILGIVVEPDNTRYYYLTLVKDILILEFINITFCESFFKPTQQ